MRFGYPKVYNDKNTLTWGEEFSRSSVVEEGDATNFNGWVMYYFAVPGIWLGSFTDDLYWKTAWARIPFALAGIVGLALLALGLMPVFRKLPGGATGWLSLFVLGELLSVSLVLHLREMRYYSIVFLLINATLFIYLKFHLYRSIRRVEYHGWMAILLILLFNTFYPACLILILFVVGAAAYHVLFPDHADPAEKAGIGPVAKRFLSYNIGTILASLLIIPMLVFFKVFENIDNVSGSFNFNMGLYLQNIGKILSFLIRQEHLLIAVLCVSVFYWLWRKSNNKPHPVTHISGILVVFGSFCGIYIAVISRFPYLFDRLFIYLQPLILMMLVLSLAGIILLHPKSSSGPLLRAGFGIILAGFLFLSGYTKFNDWKEHAYELFHQFKGPLDHTIPYIAHQFEEPKDLVIATNYAEYAYMFYFNSKVILGYYMNNAAEDVRHQPDIIIHRAGRIKAASMAAMNRFLRQEAYRKISFPVFDNLVNNIPQLYTEHGKAEHHLFRTRLPRSEAERTSIFVKTGHHLAPFGEAKTDAQRQLSVISPGRPVPVESANITQQLRYWIDDLVEDEAGIFISGWAFIDQQDAKDQSVVICLSSDAHNYAFSTTAMTRKDVTERFSGPDLDRSGFVTYLERSGIMPGNYRLGILIQKGETQQLQFTRKTLQLK